MPAPRLIINGLASHLKGRLARHGVLPAPPARSPRAEGPGADLGSYYDADLRLGLTEAADDILITSAVCKVTLKKNVVSTAIAGRDGTVKELVAAEDFEVEAAITLLADDDHYPAQALRALADLARANAPVHVDSAFLRLFDIDRVVVSKLEVCQQTWGNTQEVTLTMDSDDDYDVEDGSPI